MKKIDDILLEDIKSFKIEDKTLIIYTKNETLEYNCQSNLELLRKIFYFIHRYRFESDKKVEVCLNKCVDEKKKSENKIKKAQKNFGSYSTIATIIFSFFICVGKVDAFILYTYFGFFGISFITSIAIIIKESVHIVKELINFKNIIISELQDMQTAYDHLKEQALKFIEALDGQLLTKIKKDLNTKNDSLENMYTAGKNIEDFLEDIPYIYEEKEFQKTLGNYPYSRK